jgi:hypothetical protein
MSTLRALWWAISALCLTSQPVSADEAEIEPGTVSARQFTTLAAFGATLGLSNAVPREKLKTFYYCLDEQKRPRLELLYLQLFKERFTTDELRVIDRFQATTAADKLQQNAIYILQQESPNSFAADLRLDRPEFTQQELADVERFRGTAAGQKYRKSDLVHSADIRGPVIDKIKAAITECAEPIR